MGYSFALNTQYRRRLPFRTWGWLLSPGDGWERAVLRVLSVGSSGPLLQASGFRRAFSPARPIHETTLPLRGAGLHYEFLVNGSHKNPRTVKLPDATPVPAQELEAFNTQARPLISLLNNYKQQIQLALVR